MPCNSPTSESPPGTFCDFPLHKVELWINQLVQQGAVDVLNSKLSDNVAFAITEGTATWAPKLLPVLAKGSKGDDFYRFIGEVYEKAAIVLDSRPAAELRVVGGAGQHSAPLDQEEDAAATCIGPNQGGEG